jgi:hypothetical protein
MLRLVRIALQLVLFFALLSVAVALGAAEVGFVEKVVVAALGVLLVWLAGRVRRIGVRAQA